MRRKITGFLDSTLLIRKSKSISEIKVTTWVFDYFINILHLFLFHMLNVTVVPEETFKINNDETEKLQ